MHKTKQIFKPAKKANITATFKKQDALDKTNYRPISLLPDFLKMCDRILFNLLQRISNKFLSPQLYGLRKRCSTQYALINLPQK